MSALRQITLIVLLAILLSSCAVDEQTQAQRLVEQAGYSQVEYYGQPLIDFCEVGDPADPHPLRGKTLVFIATDSAGSPARVTVCNGNVRRID
jgi:hypothetical protein